MNTPYEPDQTGFGEGEIKFKPDAEYKILYTFLNINMILFVLLIWQYWNKIKQGWFILLFVLGAWYYLKMSYDLLVLKEVTMDMDQKKKKLIQDELFKWMGVVMVALMILTNTIQFLPFLISWLLYTYEQPTFAMIMLMVSIWWWVKKYRGVSQTSILSQYESEPQMREEHLGFAATYDPRLR